MFEKFCILQESGSEDWFAILEHWFYSRSSCNNMYLRKQPISTLGTIPNVYSTGEKSSSDIFRKYFSLSVFEEMSLENCLENIDKRSFKCSF